MVDQREIRTRARMMASAAGLGGKHLADTNNELQELAHSYNVWDFNALLAAIREQNEEDRHFNQRLPILIFANCNGGLVPDSIVPIYDDNPPWSPVADPFTNADPFVRTEPFTSAVPLAGTDTFAAAAAAEPNVDEYSCELLFQLSSRHAHKHLTIDPLETQQLPRLSKQRNGENFANEACLSAAYMQPSRHSTPTAPYFILGPD